MKKFNEIVVLDCNAAVSTDLSLAVLEQFCDTLTKYDRTLSVDTVDRIGDAQAVIVNKTELTQEVLSQCKNLKYIGLFATGYNSVDVAYAKSRGIVVANAPAYSTNGVAQLTFALIMHFYNMVDSHDQKVHAGAWENCTDFCVYDHNIAELCGKTIGLVGFGSIARKVAQLACAFDMNVLVHTRTTYAQFETESLKFVPLESLLKESDIVSLHCPLFPETANLINETTLSLMKPSAILINTARGGLVNEAALANALNNKALRGAGVDVVAVEPILSTNPLLSAKNCIITPHIAWAGRETRKRLIDKVAENIAAFLSGTPQNNVAD